MCATCWGTNVILCSAGGGGSFIACLDASAQLHGRQTWIEHVTYLMHCRACVGDSGHACLATDA